MEINFEQLMKLIRKKIWIILLIIFVCAASAFTVSKFIITPKYQSQVLVLVEPQETNDANPNFTLAKDYVDLCISRLTSQLFLDKVSENLWKEQSVGKSSEAQYTANDLREMISTEKNGNIAFSINIESTDMERAFQIARAVELLVESDLLPSRATRVDLFVMKPAERESTPVSPNVILNTVIGVLLGAVLAVVIVLLLDKMDTTIKSKEDIADFSDVPVVGLIYKHKHENDSEKNSNE